LDGRGRRKVNVLTGLTRLAGFEGGVVVLLGDEGGKWGLAELAPPEDDLYRYGESCGKY
jgi:hypothetical protein